MLMMPTDPFISDSEDCLAPINCMPAQFFQVPLEWHPERRIRMAILYDVLDMFSRAAARKSLRRDYSGAPLRKSVEWVESDDTTWPYSFVNVCEALSLEPGTVRKALLKILGTPNHVHRGHHRRHVRYPCSISV